MKPFKAIVAMSENGVIGKGNTMPWHIPEELKWFKKMTLDQVLLMGRKTYESIGRPLPRRETLVLSRGNPAIEGVQVIQDFKAITPSDDKTLWIAGGAEIYKLALPYCSDLYMTHVKMTVEGGDAFFPEYKNMFKEVEVLEDNEKYRIVHYHNDKPLKLL